MNNTKTLAIVAVLTAATLVVGLTVAAATPSAFAGGHKERQDKYMKGGQGDYKKARQTNGNDGAKANGNTVTPQSGKQYGIVSGFDNSFNQELQNLICTHPANDAVCSQEESAQTSTSTPQTCQECFTKFLTQPQINTIPQVSIAFVNCTFLVNFSESEFRTILINAGVDVTIANNLIACLRDTGIVFKV